MWLSNSIWNIDLWCYGRIGSFLFRFCKALQVQLIHQFWSLNLFFFSFGDFFPILRILPTTKLSWLVPWTCQGLTIGNKSWLLINLFLAKSSVCLSFVAFVNHTYVQFILFFVCSIMVVIVSWIIHISSPYSFRRIIMVVIGSCGWPEVIIQCWIPDSDNLCHLTNPAKWIIHFTL